MVHYIHHFNRKFNPKGKRKNHFREFCVAYEIIENGDVAYGVAFSSEQYNKAEGRRIAEERLKNSPSYLNFYTTKEVSGCFDWTLKAGCVTNISIHDFSRKFINSVIVSCVVRNHEKSELF